MLLLFAILLNWGGGAALSENPMGLRHIKVEPGYIYNFDDPRAGIELMVRT